MKNNKRVIIIGMDGVPFGLIKGLSESKVMPHINELVSKGSLLKMQSTIPEISSVAWSSIITGGNPGEHGIFGFTELSPGSYKIKFPVFDDLKLKPFWEKINGQSIIINVPSTYPVRKMNGVHVSGFVSIDFERSVYPTSLIPKLKGFDYRLDVDSQIAHESLGLFLEDLNKTLDARIKLYHYLWDVPDWQVFMFVFTETDRLMHFLWDAYQDKSHKYHEDFLDCFRKIDGIIQETNARIRKEDLLLILSDHGFERIEHEVYVNHILKKEGFLRFNDKKENTLENIDSSTKAFALDPGRIYVNLKNKYPRGSVDAKDKDKVLSDLEKIFNSLEVNNRKALRGIYRREQIYYGDFLEDAPDLILLGANGFDLKAKNYSNGDASQRIFTGKHTCSDAFLLANEDITGNLPSKEINVSDVVKIMESK